MTDMETTSQDQDQKEGPLPHADLLEEIVRALVANQDAVQVTEYMDGNVLYLDIDVAPEERGKIIGKEADTIRLIQRLFGKIGAADERLAIRVNLTKDGASSRNAQPQRPHRTRENVQKRQ